MRTLLLGTPEGRLAAVLIAVQPCQELVPRQYTEQS